MNNDKSLKQLEEQIRSAFRDVQYPGDDNIVSTAGNYEEYISTAAFFRGKHWQDLLQDDEFYSSYGCVYFLSAEAFQYYLPAMLIAALDWNKAYMMEDALLFVLAPPPHYKGDNGEYFTGRINLLTLEQKQAIYSFFLYLSENDLDVNDSYPAEQILSYWANAAQVNID